MRPLYLLLFVTIAGAPALSQDAKDAKDEKGPFKNLKYRLIGPAAGGRVSRACGVPGERRTYYAATASGGVWKSSDAGLTWKPIFDDQPTSSIGAIAVARSDPNVVYVGSGEANIRGNVQPGAGIFKSTDGGKTWRHVWKQKGQIGQVIVHPKNADIAYAAVLGSAFGPNPERGVYRTTDGGKTWQQVLKKDADTGAIDVCFDPNNPRILFAALWQARRTPWSLTSGGPGSGLYRSDDGGDTWKRLGPDGEKTQTASDETGLPPGPWGRSGVAVAPSDSRRVYALIEADKGGLYRSDDGGDSWELVQAGRFIRQRPWYFSTVHVDPKNADIVWCPNVKLLKSSDGGRTFKNVKGPHHVDHHDLWIDPDDPERMIDSNDGGVDLTTNGGATWFAPSLPIAQFYHISCDNSVPYRVLGNMQDQGTASGPSNSLSSAGITLADWHTVGGGETGYALADPSDPNIVYAGEYAGILTRYDQRTRQAHSVSIYPYNPSGKGAGELKYRFQWTAPILISPHDPKTIYHGANVLFRSRDQGVTWDRISPDLTRDDKSKQQWSGGPITGDNTGAEYYCTIFALAESPAKKGVLWAGSDDGLVHVSLDDGKTWANVTPRLRDQNGKTRPAFPEWGTVCCIEASRRDPAVAYVVVDAHRLDDNRPHLFKTADYGKSWTSLGDSLPQDDYLRVVREDPAMPGLLFVGSEHLVSFSRDDGKTWHKLKLNMPTAAVSDLVVKDNDLVVGTNGRSIWILDDLTPIRKWGRVAEKSPYLFAPPAVLRWRYHGEGYAPEERIPGENPPRGLLISYYLPEKPKQDITLELHDAAGKLVRRLTSKKAEPEAREDDPDAPWSIFKPTVLPREPGINRVAWDLTGAGPTVIPGAKNDYGVPHKGPLVLPGVYKLTLTVDDVVLKAEVEVRPDPRVKDSPTQLAARHAFAMRLRDDITQVAQTVIDLKRVRGQLQERIGLWKKLPKTGDLVQSAEKLVARLDALEDRLHNPKAEVSYDILAKKGGAKLYSQLAPLYFLTIESDGPVTQGMREVYEELAAELKLLTGQWRELLAELERVNQEIRRRELPQIVGPLPAAAGN